jgi:hypothetical protein
VQRGKRLLFDSGFNVSGMEQRERKSRFRQAGQTLSGRFQGKKLELRNRSPQIRISLSAQRKIIRLRKIGKMGRKCFHMAVPSIPF